MTKRMSILGVGPRVAWIMGVYLAVAVCVRFAWPSIFMIDIVPYPWLAAAGIVLLVITVPLYAITVRTIVKAHQGDELVTTGIYGVCRNPLYAEWILLILPAIGLLFGSWLVLGSAVVMYLAIRFQIHREEEYLEERFGQEFLDYKARVNVIFPTLWKT